MIKAFREKLKEPCCWNSIFPLKDSLFYHLQTEAAFTDKQQDYFTDGSNSAHPTWNRDLKLLQMVTFHEHCQLILLATLSTNTFDLVQEWKYLKILA